jgi:hypothetical protein
MRDPLNHSDTWQWAEFYWNDSIANSAAESRGLYDCALRKIREAGSSPSRLVAKQPEAARHNRGVYFKQTQGGTAMLSIFAPAFFSRRMAVGLWLASLSLPLLFAARVDPPGDALVAHEWGTFTSVADQNGYAASWLPLSGPSDLPCFVYRLDGRNVKASFGRVRMETPVLYFYAPRLTTLSVNVGFPSGMITEWYPQGQVTASGNAMGAIKWESVQVRPGDHPELPVESAPSHYYAARETDSAAIRIGKQDEKLIFYRGMGNVSVPLQSKMAAEGKLEVRNAGADPIPLAILFENRGGKLGYRLIRDLKGSLTLEIPELTAEIGQLRQEIEESLVAGGLYPKEAHAMVETWRDSWFEEGTRVFYIVPRKAVDSLLPLTITPAPKEVARVFVGRVEVLSPWMQKNIETALETGDIPALRKYGRFLDTFIRQIAQTKGRPVQSPLSAAFLNAAYSEVQKEFNSPAACSNK